MPALNWVGKVAVERHYGEVPFRLLRRDASRSVARTRNLIVHGDNLEALQALLPYYFGTVDLIYIDPPYNTGNETWIYNDHVRDERISAWLDKVVGNEAEDLTRHDKWLCMMHPRLRKLRDLLSPTGVLAISIDDGEQAYLRVMLDEIFGRENFLATLVWKRRGVTGLQPIVSRDHEYVILFAKDVTKVRLRGAERTAEDYPLEDSIGKYASTDMTVGMGRRERPGQFYDLVNPRSGVVYHANPNRVWRFYPDTMREVIAQNLVIWPDEQADTSMTRPRYRTRFDPAHPKRRPVSTWIESTARSEDARIQHEVDDFEVLVLRSGLNQEGTRVLNELFEDLAFPHPKPVSLIQTLVGAVTGSDGLILDSFAGSGTTGHAVINQNAEDGGHRRFILVETEDYADRVTAERLRRVIAQFDDRKDLGFDFAELGAELFNGLGDSISTGVTLNELSRFVFFLETGSPLRQVTRKTGCLLGTTQAKAIYLIFDPTKESTLDRDALLSLAPVAERERVVYADRCLVDSADLAVDRIVFKQIPRDIRDMVERFGRRR